MGSQLTPSDSPLRRKDILDGRPPLRELLADLQRSFTTSSASVIKQLQAFKMKERKNLFVEIKNATITELEKHQIREHF